jgi:hypothetical protein
MDGAKSRPSIATPYVTNERGTTMLGTEKIGRRIYITGNSFAVKDRLKSAGAHWDRDRRQWWIGLGKESAIASIVQSADEAPAKRDEPTRDDVHNRPCTGKVEYKGRTYYVVGRSERTGRLWLATLDASIHFWADEAACRWVKHYRPRESGYGKWARTEYQTLGSIAKFSAEARQAKESGECAACKRREAAGRSRPYSGHGDYDYCPMCGAIYGEC